jgi:glycosyltransferase involved in cell wall biosynthesis
MAFFGDEQGQGSFYRTNTQLIRAFRHAGVNLRVYGRFDPLNAAEPSDVAFLHPGWSAGDVVGVAGAHKLFQRIGFFDVLNYSGIGPKAKAILDSEFFDFICLSAGDPEQFNNGRRTEVIPWAQGVAREFSPERFPLPPERGRRWRPRILLEAFNPSLLRKGHDLHAKVLAKLQRRRRDFDVVVHGPYSAEVRACFKEVKGVWLVPSYGDREQQRRLWDSCDILLHLNRGGGWELQPMEVMARGLIPVIPDAKPMASYALNGAFFLVETHEWRMPKEAARRWDVGLDGGVGYEADAAGAVDALTAVLDDFDVYKSMARAVAGPFYAEWNMDRVMADNLSALFERQHITPASADP